MSKTSINQKRRAAWLRPGGASPALSDIGRPESRDGEKSGNALKQNMQPALKRHALNGPTMGTRWSARFYAPDGFDTQPVALALQAAVDEVDNQMSSWKADSDLMHLNAAPAGAWVAVPERLMKVMHLGLEIGRASGGAFDIGVGDAVSAWGFGPQAADEGRIKAAFAAPRRAAHEVVTLDPLGGRARRSAPVVIDLNGIAKGYGVDRLAETLTEYGIVSALVGIDGEMRALGLRPDGEPWTIAVEAPDPDRRSPHSILALQDAAVATSGDYRHRVKAGGRYLSHTMDPRRGRPLTASPASVTVVAQSCAEADAWATAFMVLGPTSGIETARKLNINTLFLLHDDKGEILSFPVGPLFSAAA